VLFGLLEYFVAVVGERRFARATETCYASLINCGHNYMRE
jgi:DNA-binding transcriptional LysR family regulator